MKHCRALILVLLLFLCGRVCAEAPSTIGFVVGPFPSQARDWMSEFPLDESSLAALGGGKSPESLHVVELDAAGREVASLPAQFGADPTPWRADSSSRRVVWPLPGISASGQTRRFQLRAGPADAPAPDFEAVKVEETPTDVTVQNAIFRVTYNRAHGGAISNITMRATGESFPVVMSDEFYSGKQRGMLWNYSTPAITILENGPLRATIVVDTQIRSAKFKPIRVVYAYTYWATLPVVRMSVWLPEQGTDTTWTSSTIPAISVSPADGLTSIASGEPAIVTPLPDGGVGKPNLIVAMTGAGGYTRQWGAMLDTKGSAFGIIGAASGLWGTKKGAVIAGNGDAWYGEERRWSAMLYFGPAGDKAANVAAHSRLVPLLTAEARLPAVEAAADAFKAPAPGSGASDSSSRDRVRASVVRGLKELALEYGRGGQSVVLAKQLLHLAEQTAKAPVPSTVLALDLPDGVILANDDLALCWLKIDKALKLVGIQNVQTGYHFRRPAVDGPPVWSCVMANKDGTQRRAVANATSDHFDYKLSQTDGAAELQLIWHNCPISGDPGNVDAKATIQISRGDPLSRWRLRLDPHGSELGVWGVEFPVVGSLGIHRDADSLDAQESLAACIKQGTLTRDPSMGVRTGDLYPAQYFMQFMSYWCGRGDPRQASNLYLATYDGEGYLKGFFTRPDGSSTFAMYVEHQPSWMGVAGKPFEMNYDAIVGSFRGDWYDACQTYRRWATKQVWCSRGTVDKRADVPEWFKQNCLVFSPHGVGKEGLPLSYLPKMLRLRDAFDSDLPAFVNVYQWYDQKHVYQKLPWILPAYNGFDEMVETMRQHAMPVVAYECMDLWSDERDDFQSALPSAIHTADGKPLIAPWSPGHQAVMCPSTDLYRKELVKSVVAAVEQHKIKGLYLDLLGCGAMNCFSPDHGHPIGGGNSWVQGYRRILTEMRGQARRIEPDFIILGESSAECFIDLREANVMFHGINESLTPLNLPMYQAVYGDYTMQYGPKSSAWRNPPIEGTLAVSTFIYGSMIGRFFDDTYVGMPFMESALNMARYRKAALKYFVGAQVLRPPVVEYLSPATSELQRAGLAVLTNARRAPDGSVAFMFGNCLLGPAPVQFKTRLDPREYNLNPSWRLYRLTPAGMEDIGPINGETEHTASLGPTGIEVIVAAPKGLATIGNHHDTKN